MPELKNSQEKESKLPAIVPISRTPPMVVGKTGAIGAIAVFAPLAVEVIYGLTRKWLSGTTGKAESETTDKREAVKKEVSRTVGTARYSRRYRGSRT